MSSDRFGIGDQVMLNSGGPYMTVDKIVNGQVSCIWFHEQEYKFATFGGDLLTSRKEIEGKQTEAIERGYNKLRRINSFNYD